MRAKISGPTPTKSTTGNPFLTFLGFCGAINANYQIWAKSDELFPTVPRPAEIAQAFYFCAPLDHGDE